MNHCQFRHIALLLLTTSILAGCQDGPDELSPQTAVGDSICVMLTIRTEGLTRAVPAGGAWGDGSEPGLTTRRENKVYDLTMFMISNGRVEGKYMDVAVSDKGENSTDHDGKTVYEYEVKYARKSDMPFLGDARFLVVANYGRGLETITSYATLQGQVSEHALWQGESPTTSDRFLMSSAGESTVVGTHKGTEEDPLQVHIDLSRLAARIDYNSLYGESDEHTAAYGEYSVKNTSGESVAVKGFKYEMAGGGYFILESITPFNLYDESEYLFRRVRTDMGEATTEDFLGAETTANYVIDPKTTDKVSTSLKYVNPLDGTEEPAWTSATPHFCAAEMLNGSRIGDTSNYIVSYAMENTLRPDSPLKQYATGITIHGSYYDSTNKEVNRKTFYYFLRHQSETADANAAYQAYEWDNIGTATSAAATAMNFCIVRNNIYRVSIESINPLDGRLKLKIAVHDWMKIPHTLIYS